MRIPILFLVCFSYFFRLCAFDSYHDFDRIAFVEALVDKDTLVVFDVGNTLIEGGTCWGHAKSFVNTVAKAVKEGKDREQFVKAFYPEWIEAQKYCPAQLIESSLPLLITRLQNRGIQVMALTHRPVETAASTLDQLNSVGVDLQKTAPFAEQMDFYLKTPAKYIEGVLFSGYYNNKGLTLAEFLARTGALPAKIIVVDDRRDVLENVVSTLSFLGFSVTGVHYRLPETHFHPWDAAVSEIQRKWMGSILGDAEAQALLQLQPLAY